MKEHKIKNVFVEGAIKAEFVAESIAKHSTKKNIGAHSIFLGQVRNDIIDGNTVKAIEYTSYNEMALEKFHEIRNEVFEKYDIECMHIYHSLGKVQAGEISLFVFTSSTHRKEAIKACEHTVERIKAEVPVWGKEIFENENYIWKKNN
ncbi:MAG: molybdenum cofactor biosynthesis protein MoaE [Bacteroidetes bacterium]|nr:molybdenum cofactor biosynthesis protein MoaE [Bacteroidota bacterium]